MTTRLTDDDLKAIAARRGEATFGPMRMVGEDGDYRVVDQIGNEVAVVADKATAIFFAACATDVPALVAEAKARSNDPKERFVELLRGFRKYPGMYFRDNNEAVTIAWGALAMVGDGDVVDAFVKATWAVMRWEKCVPPNWNKMQRKKVMAVIVAAAQNMGIDVTNKENEQ